MVHVCSWFPPKHYGYHGNGYHGSCSTSIIEGGQVLSSVKTIISYILLDIYSVISAYIWIRFPWIHEDIKLISFKSSSWLTRNSPLKLRSSLVWIILTWFDSLMFMRTAKKWSYEIDWDRLTIFQVSPTCRRRPVIYNYIYYRQFAGVVAAFMYMWYLL